MKKLVLCFLISCNLFANLETNQNKTPDEGLVQAYKDLVKRYPNNLNCHLGLIEILEELHHYNDAIPFRKKALEIKSSIGNSLEPYKSVDLLPFDPHGWLMPINEKKLIEFAKQNPSKPKIVVELGSWLGLSTRVIASNLPAGSQLYAVDTFFGSVEHHDGRDLGIENFDTKVRQLYRQFLSNVIHAKLTNIIVPVKMNTLDAACKLDVIADLIYVDASHEEQDVYNDIMAWYPKLATTGIMCGDDYLWNENGYRTDFPVKKAVDRAAQKLGLEVVVEGNWFWYFKNCRTLARS